MVPANVDDEGLKAGYQDANKYAWTKEELIAYDYAAMREQDERGKIELAVTTYIDRNYCRRKFRVINAVNEFMKLVVSKTFSLSDEGVLVKLTGLLQISGDASNDSYKCPAYHNEVSVGFVIFMLPMISALTALIYILFIF